MTPSTDRQKRLAAQMLEARNTGQLQLLELLRSQWVHRYGVDSIPDLAQAPSQEEPTPRLAPMQSQQQPAPRRSLGRLKALLKQSLLEVSSGLRDDRSTDPSAADPPSAAPPVNTPRSLRRWLVQDGDDGSKAS